MSAFWSATALLPDGWAQDVRFTVEDGRIASIETDTPASPGDEAASDHAARPRQCPQPRLSARHGGTCRT